MNNKSSKIFYLILNQIKKENKTNIPLLLKISPDISDDDIPDITDIALKNNISGLILTNTTN